MFSTKMIKLSEGLPLYHVTYLNTSRNREEFMRMGEEELFEKIMKDVPKDGVNKKVPNHPKFYGLAPEFPYYYGADNTNRVALKFVTTKPLLLIDLKDTFDSNEVMDRFSKVYRQPNSDMASMSQHFDGWIAFVDYPDPWREVFLFRPWECTSEGELYRLDPGIIQPGGYAYDEKEVESLQSHLIGCFDVNITEKEGELAMSIGETPTDCTSLSLLPVQE